jgi:hypothetical protein
MQVTGGRPLRETLPGFEQETLLHGVHGRVKETGPRPGAQGRFQETLVQFSGVHEVKGHILACDQQSRIQRHQWRSMTY